MSEISKAKKPLAFGKYEGKRAVCYAFEPGWTMGSGYDPAKVSRYERTRPWKWEPGKMRPLTSPPSGLSPGDILDDLNRLSSLGYAPFVPGEVLSLDIWPGILKEAGMDWLISDGSLLYKNPDLAKACADFGVKEIFLPYAPYMNPLGLPDSRFIEIVASKVRDAGIRPMFFTFVAASNLGWLDATADSARRAGVDFLSFVRYTPLEFVPRVNDRKYVQDYFKNAKSSMVSADETKAFFESLEALRSKYPDICLSAFQNFGSLYRKEGKRFISGPRGTGFAIGPDDYLYPSVFMMNPQNRIGIWDGNAAGFWDAFAAPDVASAFSLMVRVDRPPYFADADFVKWEDPAYKYYLDREMRRIERFRMRVDK